MFSVLPGDFHRDVPELHRELAIFTFFFFTV